MSIAYSLTTVRIPYLSLLLSQYRQYEKILIFFFTDTATTKIYTLSLHDALPISPAGHLSAFCVACPGEFHYRKGLFRSEEHTSELQSQSNLVCRLLLEKKN